MTVSDYIEKVIEVPLCKELKNSIEEYYKIYKKDPNTFTYEYYNVIRSSRTKMTITFIIPFLFKYYNDIIDRE